MRDKDKKSDATTLPTQAWGIAGLVLGISSMLLFLAPYIGIFLAITAIVFYRIQKKHQITGCATAGFVLGIVGTILNAIMLLVMIVGLLIVATMAPNIK